MTNPTGSNSQTNYFENLNKIDCSKHVEQKGKFNYLSWPWAIQELKKKHPNATWEVIRFENRPYLVTECGYFVEVAVTVEGITHSQIHPVLDNSNRPIAKPNSFQINTSIQRCLVKAIALHGLGLYIYAGEDLPDGEIYTPEQYEQYHALVQGDDALAFVSFLKGLHTDPERQKEIASALHNSFEAGKKSAGKECARKLETEGYRILKDSADQLTSHGVNGDADGVREVVEELDDTAKLMVWAMLNSETRQFCKEVMK